MASPQRISLHGPTTVERRGTRRIGTTQTQSLPISRRAPYSTSEKIIWEHATTMSIATGEMGRSDRIYLARVRQDHIAKRASYEFFRGKDAKGRPLWTHDITQRVPVFSDTNLANSLNGALHASVIYNPGINRYLLTVPHGDSVAQWGMFDHQSHGVRGPPSHITTRGADSAPQGPCSTQ